MMKRFFAKLLRRLRYDDILGYAAQISFYMMESMIPFLMALGTAAYRLDLIDLDVLLTDLPITHLLPRALIALFTQETAELTPSLVTLPVFVILILWFASRGFRAIMNGIHMIFRTRRSKSLLRHMVLSFIFTFGFIVLILLFLILILYGDKLMSLLASTFSLHFFVTALFTFLRYAIAAACIFGFFLLIYRTVPAISLHVRDVIPGTVFSTGAIFIVSPIFTMFSNSSTNYSFLYGSLSGVIIICTWLYVFGTILLLGAEINAVFYEIRHNTVLVNSVG